MDDGGLIDKVTTVGGGALGGASLSAVLIAMYRKVIVWGRDVDEVKADRERMRIDYEKRLSDQQTGYEKEIAEIRADYEKRLTEEKTRANKMEDLAWRTSGNTAKMSEIVQKTVSATPPQS